MFLLEQIKQTKMINTTHILEALPGTVLDILRQTDFPLTEKKRANSLLYELEKAGIVVKDQPDPKSKPIWRLPTDQSGKEKHAPNYIYRVFDVDEPENYLGFSLNEDEARHMAEKAAKHYEAYENNGTFVVLRIPLNWLKYEGGKHHEIIYKVEF